MKPHRPGILLICLLLLLSSCTPLATQVTQGPFEPSKISEVPMVNNSDSSPSSNFADAHITWILSANGDPLYQQQLDALQKLLNGAGWSVRLDVLPSEYQDDPAGYNTDAFVTSPEKAAQLYKAGVTMDSAKLASDSSPVFAEKYSELINADVSGIPLVVERNAGRRLIAIVLPNNEVPQDWLADSPSMSDIIKWVEGNSIRIGRGVPGCTQPVPFATAMYAWAAEKGYCPLWIPNTDLMNGFCVGIENAKLQIVPMENIDGFTEIYDRLLALYHDGKLFDFADVPADTDGYLSYFSLSPSGDLYNEFLRANNLSGSDIVAVPLKGADWRTEPKAVVVNQMLAIPQNGLHPEVALKIVEWALTTREGFDLVNYGTKGSDYSLRGDLILQTPEKRRSLTKLVLAWDSGFRRIGVNEPANSVELMKDTATIMPHIPLQHIPADFSALTQLELTNQRLIHDRSNILMGLLPGSDDSNIQVIPNAGNAVDLLRMMDNSGAVTDLIQAYEVELQKLMK